jgi:hypothetical protein
MKSDDGKRNWTEKGLRTEKADGKGVTTALSRPSNYCRIMEKTKGTLMLCLDPHFHAKIMIL